VRERSRSSLLCSRLRPLTGSHRASRLGRSTWFNRFADLQERLGETTQEVNLLLESVPYDQIEAVAQRHGFELSGGRREFHLRHPAGIKIDHYSPDIDLPRGEIARLMLRALAREVGPRVES